MPRRAQWQLLIPLKPLPVAKSRLDLPPEQRQALVHAFACDVVAAASGCPSVAGIWVVADDSWAGLIPHAATQVRDPGGGLNVALEAGLECLSPRDPAAVVMGDLPCIRSEDLDLVLNEVSAILPGAGVVADRDRTGSTLLAGTTEVSPHFGPDSLARHLNGHAVEVGQALPRLSLDVDDTADLRDAARVGPGPATTEALAGVLKDSRHSARNR